MEIEFEIDVKANNLPEYGSNLCRVCLTSNDENRCIFRGDRGDPENTDTNDLLEKLRVCGGVEIAENDGLPSNICAKCVIKVNDAHELRKQCQRADLRLRELYGQFLKNSRTDMPALTKDQSCQTNCLFVAIRIKPESEASPRKHEASSRTPNSKAIPRGRKSNERELNALAHESNSMDQGGANIRAKETDARARHVQTAYEKPFNGREVRRTRRMTVFKRVTSMENLKNHKERQRQYIKKSINVKRDSVEREQSAYVIANAHNTADGIYDSRRSYKCSKCDRRYCNKKSLNRHMLTHNEMTFTCEKCDKRFLNFEKLARHYKLHKAEDKPKSVLCKICDKSFRKFDTMVRHLHAHKRTNPKEVISILKEIRDKRKLENILEKERKITALTNFDDRKATKEKTRTDARDCTNTVEKAEKEIAVKPIDAYLSGVDSIIEKLNNLDDGPQYRCKCCGKSYASEKSLQSHLLIHDEKKYVCNVCNMKFFRQDRLRSHKSRYGHDDDKECPETQKPPNGKSAIKLINSWIREELDSDNEGKDFPCKICGKSYDTRKSLVKHERNIHGSRQKNCDVCGNACTCALKSNAEEKLNENTKLYRCVECNESFEKEVKLQRHVRTHERAKEQQDANFKRFLCHICSKTFRQNTGLMFHMRTHTGYKPHVCKYCGRGFTSNSNCINHERTHTGDRPFVCHFCSAAFAKSCTLKAHITTHTGEANYHCKTCGKSFKRLKYLKEHRFTHTGEKPYACKICGTAYSHSGSLFVHEKKCKAQYSNYQQLPNSAQSSQSYCQSQTSSPTETPILTAPLPTGSNLTSEDVRLVGPTNKTYMDDTHRMNPQSISTAVNPSDLPIHPTSDISEVKSFSLIGQMFQS